MLITAREEGFREAMEIFGLTIDPNEAKVETGEFRRGKRRNIREMIIKELSFSGRPMTKYEIAQAIDYLPKGTETVLKRLENQGIVQTQDGHWEAVGKPVIQSNGHAKAV